VGIVIALVPARSLLTTTPAAPTALTTASAESTVARAQSDPAAKRRSVPRRIWILAALALMCMLCEGVANDWSALEAKTVLGAPAATAWLLADRVSRRFGSAAVLRYGAAAGAVGLTVVALSPWIWAALVGWAIFGLGLSGCVPQLFSAAGHTDPAAAGANVSRVAGLGYLGMLAGPALIGWMTRLMGLNRTFLLPALLLVLAAVAAGILRTGSERASEPEPELARRP
jgi:MFS family permease